MTKLEKVLYTARVRTTGGRDGGASRTGDGRLQVALSAPGIFQTGANPEQQPIDQATVEMAVPDVHARADAH